MVELPIHIRLAVAEDVPFIVSSWLSTARIPKQMSRAMEDLAPYYAGCLDLGRQHPSMYFGLHRQYITHKLSRPDAVTLVAAFDEDPTLIAGYACGTTTDGTLLYCCVKEQYQGQGIGRMLVEAVTTWENTETTDWALDGLIDGASVPSWAEGYR